MTEKIPYPLNNKKKRKIWDDFIEECWARQRAGTASDMDRLIIDADKHIILLERKIIRWYNVPRVQQSNVDWDALDKLTEKLRQVPDESSQ